MKILHSTDAILGNVRLSKVKRLLLLPPVAVAIASLVVLGSCGSKDGTTVWVLLTDGSATRVSHDGPMHKASESGQWISVDVAQRAFEVTERHTAVDIGHRMTVQANISWHVAAPRSFAESYLSVPEFERDYLKPLVGLLLYDALLELESRIVMERTTICPQDSVEFLKDELRKRIGAEQVFGEVAIEHFGFALDGVDLTLDCSDLR